MNVHISQFYSCSKVELACELYYICELGKYLKYYYNDSLSIDGVIISSDVLKSDIWDFFRLSVSEGWVVETGIARERLEVTIQNPLREDLTLVKNVLYTLDEVPFSRRESNMRRSDLSYAYRTPEKLQVSFAEMSSERWIWTYAGEDGRNSIVNNKAFGHNLAHQCWVSLVAFVAVRRLKTGEPRLLGLKFSQNTIKICQSALGYLDLLNEGTNCLYGWCFYTKDDSISKQDKLQLGYMAWYLKGKDLGLLSRWYSAEEKLRYLKKLDIRIGDIVAVYERVRSQKKNYIKSISSCRVGKVRYITKTGIGLELFNTVKTKFQAMEDFKNKSIAVKMMYMNTDSFAKFNSSETNYDINDVGVEYMMFNEKFFLVPLTGCDDEVVLRVTDGVRKDTLCLPQNEAIYWILKDYGVEFNEEHFLKVCFPDSVPAFTRYMDGGMLEDSYYVNTNII